MSEWRTVRLGDEADLLTGNPFKSDSYIDDKSQPRLLRGDNIAQGWLRWDGVKRWPVAETSGLDAYWLERGDVVLAMDRPWIDAGLKYAAVNESDLPALLVQRVCRIRGSETLATGFLRYVIGGNDFTNHVLAVQTGTAVPHISRKQIEEFEFLAPGLEEQRKIARILGTLDDKIELNRRMNETLEAMARAIFQSWFVDFDPVRAKASGESADSICQRLGLTPELLALFPDGFEDSELGEIPTGWLPTRLDDVLELAYGKALKATDRIDGEIPVYGSGGVTGYHNESLIDGPAIIVGRKGTVGSLYWEDRSSYPIDTVFYVKPKVKLTYCFYLLQTLALETMNTDAAVPGLNRNNVYRLLTSLPSEKVREAFDDVAMSVRRQMRANTEELQTLSEVRDALLPKLLSGELMVQGSDFK